MIIVSHIPVITFMDIAALIMDNARNLCKRAFSSACLAMNVQGGPFTLLVRVTLQTLVGCDSING